MKTWSLAAALLGLAASCSDGEAPRKLNVLLVTLDTTRADRLSCYGHEGATTPRLDALAAEGIRFERAISTAGITPMSHASILTGLNNYRHGMRVFYSEEVSHRLDDSAATLPEILKQHGWKTAASISSYPVSAIYGLDQGFDTFGTKGLELEGRDFSQQQRHATMWLDGPTNGTQRRGDETVDEALAWLDAEGKEGPWMMWVHLFDVHDFSIVPPEDFARERGVEYDRSAPPTNVAWRDRMYDPELAFMDAQIGRLFDWLEASGQKEDTLIVITADHGQGLSDGKARHGWFKHRLLYDWSLHVPLILYVPGETGGVAIPDQVRTIDVFPTVLEALNLAGPDIEGTSLFPLARGERELEPRIAYADALTLYDAHAPRRGLPPNCRDNLFALSDGRWKYIHHETRPAEDELFDLHEDPLETENLARRHQDVVARFRAMLEERGAMRVTPPSADGERPDSNLLHGLGYTPGEDEDEEEDGH